jgi:hypothetical protein
LNAREGERKSSRVAKILCWRSANASRHLSSTDSAETDNATGISDRIVFNEGCYCPSLFVTHQLPNSIRQWLLILISLKTWKMPDEMTNICFPLFVRMEFSTVHQILLLVISTFVDQALAEARHEGFDSSSGAVPSSTGHYHSDLRTQVASASGLYCVLLHQMSCCHRHYCQKQRCSSCNFSYKTTLRCSERGHRYRDLPSYYPDQRFI